MYDYLKQDGLLDKMLLGNEDKFRIRIGTSPLNPNIARSHMYIPKSFVSNSFANPLIEVKRSIFHLIKTFK